MSKTILERMCSISKKMRDKDGMKRPCLNLSVENMSKARGDLAALRKTLGMNTMQVLIMTAAMQNAYRRQINGDDLASFLGLDYLKLLTYNEDINDLKKKGYIRTNKEGNFILPAEVLKSLMNDKAMVPEQTDGLDTGGILSFIRRRLSFREDDELTTDEALEEIEYVMKANPETSIGRTYNRYMEGISSGDERFLFAVLIHLYYHKDDDYAAWYKVDNFFEEDELEVLKFEYKIELMGLQMQNVIEYAGEDGLMTKDLFKIKDDIKGEIFADIGGIKKKKPKVSASKKIDAGSIGRKELFYNPAEQRQVELLQDLISGERFNGIREKLKEKGLRTGFSCIFYGGPGTGKTETVYQIARASGRDLFVVDVSQIKSCWVGESEKNIKDVFNRYRQCVAAGGEIPILLFNEADAIFGNRLERVGDAVDQMENSIQNIILQEMEDLDGIVIATTNLTCNLDRAFERRFLYKIRFEKPSVEARSRIWKMMIPELSETESLQLAADFDFSGGQIENIARKKTVKGLISGQDPTFADIREYCGEETIGDGRQYRKIGF